MGFYFRKSKSVGPFRINFSKSGIGISAGVKGARISMGPKGTYLNAGRGGLYYRRKIGGSSKKNYARAERAASKTQSYSNVNSYNSQPTQKYNLSMNPNGIGNTIIETINKTKIYNIIWWISIVALLTLSFIYSFCWTLVIADIIVRFVLKKWFTLYIDFELEGFEKKQWDEYIDALEIFGSCSGKWITTKGSYYLDTSSLKNAISFKKSKGGFLLSGRAYTKNEYVSFTSSKIKVYFLPQIILLQYGTKNAAYTYDELDMDCDTTSIALGSEDVPKDAEVEGYVFEHTTKDGTPDLRYKVNRRFPECQFITATFSSHFGCIFTLIGSNKRIEPILKDVLKMYHPKIIDNILIDETKSNEINTFKVVEKNEDDIKETGIVSDSKNNVESFNEVIKRETESEETIDNSTSSNSLLSEIISNTKDKD